MKKLIQVLQLVQSINPWAIFNVLITQVLTLSQPYVLLFYSAKIINLLIDTTQYEVVMREVIVFLIIMYILSILKDVFTRINTVSKNDVYYRLDDKLTKKSLSMDYEALCDPENRLKFQRAEEGSNFSGGIFTFLDEVLGFIFSIIISIGVAGTAVVLLFTSKSVETSSLAQFSNSFIFSLVLVLLMVIPVLVSVVANSKASNLQFEGFQAITLINREFSYYSQTILTDNTAGKTIRLYNGDAMILKVFEESSLKFSERLTEVHTESLRYRGGSQIVTLLAMGILYSMIGVKAMVGAITIGSVLMISGYIQTLVLTLVNGLGKIAFLQNMVNYLQFFIDYLNLPDAPSGDKPVKDLDTFELKFDNVSFSYPGSDKKVLDSINLTITDKEKIAIVGQNGAGKTSFIKLICRLYEPTSGTISLNGVDIKEMDREDYLRQLSVVFQDYHLYPFEIADNVTLGTAFDEQRVMESLEVTGVSGKVKSLEKGIHTSLKGQYDDGVQLSGGESQKIAIARAWYKDTPLVILDEPTAALDPISEYEIYRNFDELMDSKTAIYVSHRMSSCRFCDRVLVFDLGKVIQDGHHDELIEVDDMYAHLFNAQAQYYIN
ncbi:ABC transporter ATP-binding protein [Erysipelothrix sp. HDW6A]|uniref:ABC transporter ATP-binding protein n=1 Tax=Erysipelothrix sp. HDW6A TaxID=2714928 RepID=UPI00140D871A|nr:ABC transporter ATP-binding protein [Erysipelothrix sp. HDW6A]QIK58034.1 ABC transporter ATP-binding protein [Erysipelothrix sp. HDW6A]